MDPLLSGALETWSPNLFVIALLIAVACVYIRGWRRQRRLIRTDQDSKRLTAFLSGLVLLALTLESPLDALDGLFLSAHMVQHLMLLMVAPPLLLLGQPTLPLLRGLPRRFVKEGLGPFLTWPALRNTGHWLTAMPVAWLVFTVSTLLWHVPRFYELALHSSAWHGAQHACFFWSGVLFWWPVILQEPAKRRWPEWTLIPYLGLADNVNTALAAFFIFSGSVLYPSYRAARISGFTAKDDQALAGAIMWVPGSIIYLLPAIFFAMRILSPRPVTSRPVSISRVPRPPVKQGGSRWTRHLPSVRRGAQIAMLLLAVVIIVDGFTGSQVTPLNSAGVLPWIHWRALSIIALLTVGNLFCAACPFVLVRDIGRRVLPAKLRWPRALRNKWLPIGLLLLYFWAYEALGLWNSPWSTSCIIVGYFAAALIVDGLCRGASFCKYVCPIGQFHFVTSLVSPREVKIREAGVCGSCRTFDCIRGNAKTRGCELDLFQPKKESSLDCTFCLDCIKACPHDNVSILPVLPAETLLDNTYRSSIGRLAKRTDYAALVLLIVFGAFVNAAGMIGPVMMMEHRWHARFGPHGMSLAIAAFTILGAVVLPLALVGICAIFTRSFDVTRRFVFTLVPIGVGMWAAHLMYHFITVLTAGLPSWLTPLQLVLLDAGVLWTLYLVWRLAGEYANKLRRQAALWAPWSAVALGLYALGVWILLQPMDMRGMMH